MIRLFTEDDFGGDRFLAEFANTKLNAYLQCQEKVYGDIKLGSYHHKPLFWSVDEKEDSTHSCRVIDIERIDRLRNS